MIKRRRLNPNYRSEHVLEPLEPEPDQWLEEDGEDLVAEAGSPLEPAAEPAERPLAGEPMEALFAELLAEDEEIGAPPVTPEPAALEMELAFEPEHATPAEEPVELSHTDLAVSVEAVPPEAVPEPELPLSVEAGTPEPPAAPLLLADVDLPAGLNSQLLAEPAEPEDLELDFSSWPRETEIPAVPEMLAGSPLERWAEEPTVETPEPLAAGQEPSALVLPSNGMDAVYEALDDEIESPEAMDLLDFADVLPEPGESFVSFTGSDSTPAASPQPPAPAVLDLTTPAPEPEQPEAVTADPAADFDGPVEAVLSEVAQIIAARGQSLLARTPKPAESEPLPAQPALEDVVSSIDEALQGAPALAPAGSAPATPHRQFSQLDDYVVFSLSGGDYAIPVRDVAEIGRIPVITRIPNVPDFIRGLTNLRGEVVPLLNLPTLLGLQDTHPSVRGRVLFLHGGARGSATGLVVDEVKGIQRIQSTQLEQVSGLVDDKVTSVLRGVHGRGDRLLNVLDLEQLFAMPEFRQLEM